MQRLNKPQRFPTASRRFEALESRALMAGMTCALADGTLTICGTDDHDQVAVVAGDTPGTIAVRGANDAVLATFASADVQSIAVLSAAGDDRVQVDPGLARSVLIDGGDGVDIAVRNVAAPSSSAQHNHSHAPAETFTLENIEQVLADAEEQSQTQTTASALSVAAAQSAALSTSLTSSPAPSLGSFALNLASTATVTTSTYVSSGDASHGNHDAPVVVSAASVGGNDGHQDHAGGDGTLITPTALNNGSPAMTLNNPIVMAGSSTTSVAGSSYRTTSADAKACELKTTFSRRPNPTLYTRYECKCDERRWSARKAGLPVTRREVEEKASPGAALALVTRPRIALDWAISVDLCTEHSDAISEFDRLAEDYASPSAERTSDASETVALSLDIADDAPNYFQALGAGLFGLGLLGLAATNLPQRRLSSKREEEMERASYFLPLEALAR